MSSLCEKATSGVLWSAFERYASSGCVLVVQFGFSRLIGPRGVWIDYTAFHRAGSGSFVKRTSLCVGQIRRSIKL